METYNLHHQPSFNPERYKIVGMMMGIICSCLVVATPLWFVVLNTFIFWCLMALFFSCQVIAWFGLNLLNKYLNKYNGAH